VVRAPGEQPGLHVLAPDVVAGFYLSVRLPHFGQHSFLVGHIRFDCIGNQEIRAAAGGFGQTGQPPLDFRFEPNAKRAASCVRHEHIIADESTRS